LHHRVKILERDGGEEHMSYPGDPKDVFPRKFEAEPAQPPAPRLQKRPVAWRVKDYADGWVIFQDEAAAYRLAEETGALMQGLYVRDGT
jgi:hypothetical protein